MNDGRKDDAGKPRPDLLPAGPLLAVSRVLAFGAKKYGDNNWHRVPEAKTRYHAAALRHLLQWASGEARDPDTGESHLAHVACCVLFLLWFEERDAAKAEAAPAD